MFTSGRYGGGLNGEGGGWGDAYYKIQVLKDMAKNTLLLVTFKAKHLVFSRNIVKQKKSSKITVSK